MKTEPIAQLAPAIALEQLLQEYPGLPVLTWEVRAHAWPRLVGTNPAPEQPPFDVLRAYAEVLGGSIRPAPDAPYESLGHLRQVHELSAVWRDVTVLVRVSADAPNQVGPATAPPPAPAAAATAEGAL